MAVRPIDAEVAKKRLQAWIDESDAQGFDKAATCFRDCISLLDAVPTLTPTNEWVSVEERLPEPGEDALLYFGGVGNTMTVGGRYEVGDGWYSITDSEYYTDCDTPPTHWMPLPVPPDEPAHDMNVVLQRALDTWGAEAQTRMMFEEMAELQKELCKWLRGLGDREHIAEEIADVEIMLDQMKLLHNCADEVKSWRLRKLGRLSARLST